MKRIALSQYLIEEQRRHNRLSPDLRLLIEVVARACKSISLAVRKSALEGNRGTMESLNVQGEIQKKLDVYSNDLLLQANEWGGHLAAMASEEMESIYPIPNRFPSGEYLLLFDPLDGSSNIDVNVSIGTIFSVLRAPAQLSDTLAEPREQDFLQSGRQQVAAGYAVYGPQTSLVLSIGNGVQVFHLDTELGSWILTQEHLQIPRQTQEFSVNLSNLRHWSAPVRRYIDELLAGADGARQKNFNMRWIASMVADVHRLLTRGGIFMYPADARPGKQLGHLRLMYEANPMAYLIEQAGGRSSDGQQSILDIEPRALHQRTPVFIGASEEIERIEAYLKQGAR